MLFHSNPPWGIYWPWEASLHKFLVDIMLGNQFSTPRTKVTRAVLLKKIWELWEASPGMLTWRCSTQARSSGWWDPLHIHSAAPDGSWPCPLSQTPSPSQSPHRRQWCYRQFAWWISWEEEKLNVNQVLPSSRMMPKRAQLFILMSCGPNLCTEEMKLSVNHLCSCSSVWGKWHCLFTGLNKTTRAFISQDSE